MKKHILPILALTLLLSGCSKETPTPQPSASSPASTKPQNPEFKTVYIRTSHTQTSGESDTRTDYLLDEENLVCQVVIYTNGTETGRYDVECDENGNYIRWIGENITSTFHYDEKGRPLGKSVYAGELMISSTEYIWENGNQVGVVDSNGPQEQRTAWFYNENGQKVREELYQNGVLTKYSQIIPGEDGRPISQDVYMADGALHSTVAYRYDGMHCTTITTLTDGTVEQQAEYTYDEHGNLVSTTVYDSEGQMISQVVDVWKAIEVPKDSLRASI